MGALTLHNTPSRWRRCTKFYLYGGTGYYEVDHESGSPDEGRGYVRLILNGTRGWIFGNVDDKDRPPLQSLCDIAHDPDNVSNMADLKSIILGHIIASCRYVASRDLTSYSNPDEFADWSASNQWYRNLDEYEKAISKSRRIVRREPIFRKK